MAQNYEKENLRIMKVLDNYSAMIYSKIEKFLGKKILEVGAGVGTFTKYIVKDFREVTSIDKCGEIKGSSFRVKNFDIEKGDIGGFRGKFDTVVCINVLEHIKDHEKVLRNMYECLNKGNLILIVPAIKGLYGSIDQANNHYRRYDKKEIKRMMLGNGFRIKEMKYINFIGIFGWLYHNKVRKFKIHKKKDLIRFDHVIPLISFVENILPPPLGLSLLVVGAK